MLALSLTANALFAQQQPQQYPKKDTIHVGTITGALRDSAHNYVMQSATLALYKVAGDSLISYQLSNNFGKYEFKNMPVGVLLRIIATNIGYSASKKEFTIPAKLKKIDLQTMNMNRQADYLKEVNISATPPPMQMKGDTLEFNAAAFKLDPNAVVEDMLRKLPGVTVWGDGVITVNGKAIKQLLVDGKDFFGGNNKIALQNIPKSSIQKVQVYKDKEDPDPINPATNMNIVLKKDKKDGLFGKLGFGYGTDKRYAGDGMISYFSPKTQLNFVGTANNVNKSAYDANALVGYNSFKGEGINNDYHSDFTRQGLNVFKAVGASYSHDFSRDNDTRQAYYKTNTLKADYFLSDATGEVIGKNQTLVSLGTGGQLQQSADNTGKSTNTNHRSNANYNKRFEHGSIYAAVTYNNSESTSNNTQNNTSINTLTSAQTQSFGQQMSSSNQKSINGNIRTTTERYYDFGKNKQKSISTEINYNFNVNNGDRESTNITDFKATDASQNKYFNRRYLTDFDNNSHSITTNFRGITGLFQRNSPFITTDLRNTVSFNTNNETVNVGDLPSGSSAYANNANLSNKTSYRTIDERPGIAFSKYFYKGLDNRFSKNWNISVFAESQFYSLRNTSQKAFQNLDRSYYYFIPSASLSYSNNQIGDSYENFTLSYNTSVTYPNISQLAPLIDDANVYSITVGNLNLKPAYKHEIQYRYDRYGQTKNTFSANFSISAGVVNHNITDSTNYDALGRNVRYIINGSGNKYVNLNNGVRKIYKWKDHQFEINGNVGGGYQRYPSSVNGQNYETEVNTLNGSSALTYSYKGLLVTSVGEKFNGAKTIQGSLSRSTVYNWGTDFGLAFALPRSIFFNTRVNFNNNKSSFTNNIYYTIWNADLGYRFLKGNNAEIKFSALDLLHQNKSVINNISNNSITTGTVNTLQQYFMLTVAYYPRKFGFGGKK